MLSQGVRPSGGRNKRGNALLRLLFLRRRNCVLPTPLPNRRIMRCAPAIGRKVDAVGRRKAELISARRQLVTGHRCPLTESGGR
jgi:hypothetical protein